MRRTPENGWVFILMASSFRNQEFGARPHALEKTTLRGKRRASPPASMSAGVRCFPSAEPATTAVVQQMPVVAEPPVIATKPAPIAAQLASFASIQTPIVSMR